MAIQLVGAMEAGKLGSGIAHMFVRFGFKRSDGCAILTSCSSRFEGGL